MQARIVRKDVMLSLRSCSILLVLGHLAVGSRASDDTSSLSHGDGTGELRLRGALQENNENSPRYGAWATLSAGWAELPFFFFFFKYLFIWEDERERTRERERMRSRVCAHRGAQHGARSHGPEVRSWAEPRLCPVALGIG